MNVQDVESALARIWSTLLDRPADTLDRDASFFAIGGDSLLLVRAMDRINETFFADRTDSPIPIAELFRNPSIRRLAARLCAHTAEVTVRESGNAAATDTAIAIVGMAGRFPGARTLEAFWESLVAGKELLTFLTREELLRAGVKLEDLANPRYVPCAGLIEDLQLFDAEAFGMPPGEAAITSPEHRLLLECAYEALEAAGYGNRWRDERVGVFVGTGLSTYLLDHLAPTSRSLESAAGMRQLIGNTTAATRISYFLDLRGPSITLDTACSSSLVAVHQACRALLAGECELALAGGATVRRFGPRGYLAESGGIFSSDGHCRPFDREAQGTIGSSGAGIVLLKTLSAAVADRDWIHAVIRGSAINNDGRAKLGYTAPSVSGQAEVLRAAYRNAGVDPGSVRFVEAHGTATSLGDAIEISALQEVLGGPESGAPPCALGALKANVGHMEAAAGVGSLIKTALVVERRVIPPMLHFKMPHAHLRLESSRFHINTAAEPWPESEGPVRAAVSSFGIGGTNAHAILEEAPPRRSVKSHRNAHLLVLSARSPEGLQALSTDLVSRISSDPTLTLAEIAYSLQVGRAPCGFRRFCVCETLAEAVAVLSEPGAQAEGPVDSQEFPVVFQFSDDHSAAAVLSDAINKEEPVFRREIERCSHLQAEGNAAVLFGFRCALARLWTSWGIRLSTPPQSTEAGSPVIIRAIRGEEEITLASFDERGSTRAYPTLLNAVGRLWQLGYPINWHAFNAHMQVNRVPLPTVPFERRRHWIDPPAQDSSRLEERPASRRSLERLFHVPVWKQCISPTPASSRAIECCVVFARENEPEARLFSGLRKVVPRVIRVLPGPQYQRAGDDFILDAADTTQYSRLLGDIAASGLVVNSFVHAWSSSSEGPAAVEDRFETSLYSVLHLVQALATRASGRSCRLLLLTMGAHSVLGTEMHDALSASVAAVAAIVARECPGIECRSLDVDPNDIERLDADAAGRSLLRELTSEWPDTQVALRGSQHWKRTYEALSPASSTSSRTLLRHGGVYLLTGGLGGIGYTLAQYLASKFHARLILAGRSAVTAGEPTSRIRALESAGAEVLALRADVSNREHVRELVRDGVARFGALHGVIHCAGIASTGPIASRSREQVAATVAAKIAGTSQLFEETRALAPDFFLCCSSLASVVAPTGFFDYCAANAFQDAFAHTWDGAGRTRVIAVNWDAWKDVGFAERAAAEGRDVGNPAFAISPEEGVQIFDRVLRNPRPQWVISTRPLGETRSPSVRARPEEVRSRSSNSRAAAPTSTEESLAAIWCSVLGVAGAAAGDDFFALGGDSLLAVELGMRIEAEFGKAVAVRELLKAPTLSGMAHLLESGAA